jgi:hypothetical protein
MVPYLGAALTLALIAGVCLMNTTPQMTLLVTLSAFVLHSVFFDYVVTPRVVGQHVGLHPILCIIALLVGGSLFGILGRILAVPVAATVQRIALTVFPKLSQTIEVPAGEDLHALAVEVVPTPNGEDEVETAMDVHQTIIAAVDCAEDKAEHSPSLPPGPSPSDAMVHRITFPALQGGISEFIVMVRIPSALAGKGPDHTDLL